MTDSIVKKVYVGADHGGFALKEEVKKWLLAWGYQVEDVGASVLNDDDDYPTFAFALAQAVATDDNQSRGVLCCRSGGGMAVAANKVAGIRAVPVYSPKQAAHAVNDDHANVITLAGDWMTLEEAQETLKAFITTMPSQEERHQRRVDAIKAYEEKGMVDNSN